MPRCGCGGGGGCGATFYLWNLTYINAHIPSSTPRYGTVTLKHNTVTVPSLSQVVVPYVCNAMILFRRGDLSSASMYKYIHGREIPRLDICIVPYGASEGLNATKGANVTNGIKGIHWINGIYRINGKHGIHGIHGRHGIHGIHGKCERHEIHGINARHGIKWATWNKWNTWKTWKINDTVDEKRAEVRITHCQTDHATSLSFSIACLSPMGLFGDLHGPGEISLPVLSKPRYQSPFNARLWRLSCPFPYGMARLARWNVAWRCSSACLRYLDQAREKDR